MASNMTWNHDQIIQHMTIAATRAAIGAGMAGMAEMKINAHKVSGTLSRSIHLGEAGYENDDIIPAQDGNDLGGYIPNIQPNPGGSISLFVGSWIEYAATESGRGGAHDFVTPGLVVAQAVLPSLLEKAFQEEGLTQ